MVITQEFSWSADKYISEVENGSDPGLQEYQIKEIEFLTKISGAEN